MATESRSAWWIQISYKDDGRGWRDLEGQLTDGYSTLAGARKAFAAGRPGLADQLAGVAEFRVVHRTINETAFDI